MNPWRGEVALSVDGQPRVMRLTLGALAELEARLKSGSLMELIGRFETGAFRARLMRLGLVRLGLAPEVFWGLTPAELMLLAGAGSGVEALTRAGLDERKRSADPLLPWVT